MKKEMKMLKLHLNYFTKLTKPNMAKKPLRKRKKEVQFLLKEEKRRKGPNQLNNTQII
jgi:hypothetical protein